MPKRTFLERPLGFLPLTTSRFRTTNHFAIELQENILQFLDWKEKFRLYMSGVMIPGGPMYKILNEERNRQLRVVIDGLRKEVSSLKQLYAKSKFDKHATFRRERILKSYDSKIYRAERIISLTKALS
jgi:hypothetical protein